MALFEEWYSAQELAEMSLPDLPKNKRNINKFAKCEQWVFRARRGRGGGREYSVHSLPPRAFAALSGFESGLEPRFESGLGVELDRETAKGYMVDLLGSYAAATGLPIRAATERFVTLFHRHKAARDTSVFSAPIQAALSGLSVRSLTRWRLRGEPHSFSSARPPREGESAVLAVSHGGAVASYIAAILVTQPQLGPGHIRDLVRAQFGPSLTVATRRGEIQVELPHIRSFERFISTWRRQNAQLHLKMTNPDAYKNKYQVALGSQSALAHGLNAVWEIDASPVDALCVDGRFTLYAVIDVWSRRAMFFASKTPKTEASLQIIRRAIMAWGVPETIKTDNGSDFTSYRFKAALAALGIEQKLCPPYTPEGKPHVERVIKTIQHNLMPMLPGYVGHNVADRSQITARKTFAQKLGVDDHKAFAVSMNRNDLQGVLDRWAEDKYAHRAHAGLKGITPFAKYNSWTGEVRRIANESALALLLAPIAGSNGYRTITKKQLRIEGRQYYGPDLELYIGSRVMVRHDPDDFGKVYVFSEDGNYLCEARDYLALPQDDQAKLAQTARLSQKKHIKEAACDVRHDAREYDLAPHEITETLLDQARDDRSNLVEMTRPSTPYQTTEIDSAGEAMGGASSRPNVLSFPEPSPSPIPKKTTREQDEDEWWERRRLLFIDQSLGKTLSERDVLWLAWYEARPEFIVREHFRAVRAAQLNGDTPEDLEDF